MTVKPIKVGGEKAARPAKSGRAAERASTSRSKLDAMADVVKKIASVRPASQVVRKIEAVPSIFPIFDQKNLIGGIPTGRVILVHGPSAQGKTPFGIGLGRSFLERGHFFNFIDAEHATDEVWGRSLLGEYYDSPAFTAPSKIGTYEDVRAGMREWMDSIGNARENKELDEDVRAIALVDSIGRLVPKSLWDELARATKADNEDAKKKKGRFGKPKAGVDGMGGRAGQIKAAFNQAWLGELVALCADTRSTVVMIARETVEEGEGFFADDVITVNGGRALLYDSSLWLRVVDQPIWRKVGDKDKGELVGARHTIQIRRSKLGERTEKIPEAAYHTSNGVSSPKGFDRTRDVWELGLEMGLIEASGSHYSFEGEKLGQGAENILAKLRDDPELCFSVEDACRSKFKLVG